MLHHYTTEDLRMQSLLLLLIFIQILVLDVSAQNIQYVKPNNSLPLNCPSQPCLTLGQYVKESSRYFTSGSTFIFLPGNHSLETTVHLTDISNMTLRGTENNINILYMNEVTIRCISVTNLIIEQLIFVLNHVNENAAFFFFEKCKYSNF